MSVKFIRLIKQIKLILIIDHLIYCIKWKTNQQLKTLMIIHNKLLVLLLKHSKFLTYFIFHLQISDYTKIIYWSSNGLEFTIKDISKFEEIVLPKYFRHNKMNSFVRQLNMYGFHKTKHNNFKSTFKHPMFQKGQEYFIHINQRFASFS